jgi:predicted RNase H-like HicB family nuclease
LSERKKLDTQISVLCKFWFEDGVWNGSAHDLPVAVFGQTIDEAKKNLGEALVSHFDALQQIGKAG